MQKLERSIGTPIRPLALAVMASIAGQSHSAEIDVGSPDIAVRWDTTVKYSVASRLKSADRVLLENPNDDDGDRNFGKGIISNRFDAFTEFDAIWKKSFGARISAAAYYDSVYNKTNDNPGSAGGAFPNQVSGPYDKFTSATRRDHGRHAEILDALVFGKFDLAGMDLNLRVGKHALIWGESLFFGGNAIAGAQAPVDAVKLLSVPNTQFKEAIRPVPQISGQLQISSKVSVGAYLQTQWQADKLPAVGSYFSSSDVAVDGGESILLGPGQPPALRQADVRPRNSGQGGVQVRIRGEDTDYGLYAVRFHSKLPQLVARLGATGAGVIPTGYYLAYQQDITAFGASASHTFGNFNVAIEGSFRRNQDLASTQGADLSAVAPVPQTDNTGNPGYAVGHTAHVNVSTLASLDPNFLWREATLTAEIAWNRLLKITKNPAAADPNGTRDGTELRFVLEPTYRGVFPSVDIGVPFGLGWAPSSSRPLASGGALSWTPAGGGDMSIGIDASFRDEWRFSLVYTHYYGAAAPLNDAATNAYTWKQSLRDRDFVAASLRYSF